MKRFLLALVLLLSVAPSVRADIGYDNGLYGSYVVDLTSQTFSYTVSTSANRYLVACVTADFTNDYITSVTYNGVSMSLVNKQAQGRYRYMFVLSNPASGAHNVVVTASSPTFIQTSVASYIGVRQSGQPEDDSMSDNSDGPLDATVTTVAANAWTVDCFSSAAGIGTYTNFVPRVTDTDFNTMTLGDRGPVVTPGSTTMTAESTSGSLNSSIIISLAPALVGVDFDNALYGGYVASASQTFSYTVASASGGLLVVCVAGDQTTDLVSGVTYNGVAMTLVAKLLQTGARWHYLFYQKNPTVGAHNVVVSGPGGFFLQTLVSSYIGVGSIGSNDTSVASGAAVTTNLTTTRNNSWTVMCFDSSAGFGTLTNMTERVRDEDFNTMVMGDYGPITPPGAVSMTVDAAGDSSGIMFLFGLSSVGNSWSWLLGGFR